MRGEQVPCSSHVNTACNMVTVWGGFGPDRTVPSTPHPLTGTYSYLLAYLLAYLQHAIVMRPAITALFHSVPPCFCMPPHFLNFHTVHTFLAPFRPWKTPSATWPKSSRSTSRTTSLRRCRCSQPGEAGGRREAASSIMATDEGRQRREEGGSIRATD